MSDRKSLMIVTVSLTSGGLERIVANVANRYIENGWKVTILTLLNPEGKVFVELNKKVKHLFFKDIASNDVSSIKKALTLPKWVKFIKTAIKGDKPDCILAMTIKIGSMVVLAGGHKKSRLVVREISDPKSVVRNQLVNKICFHFCKNAHGFIYQTEWEKSCFPKKLQEKGSVIPNPVVLKTYAKKPKRKSIVTMGRLLNVQKRHDVLIKSFGIFSEKHPDYSLEIYGEGPDLEKDIQLVAQLHLEDKVMFMGATKNVHEKICDASCFVLTSEFEGLSNALLEAYLMGIPCITSDWPGANEVITDGVDGLIVKRGEIGMLSDAIENIISNPIKAQLLASNAVKKALKYDSETVFKQYESIIEGK